MCASVKCMCMLHWWGILRAWLPPDVAPYLLITPSGLIPAAPPVAPLSLDLMFCPTDLFPMPGFSTWTPWCPGEGRCPNKHVNLTCDVAETQVAKGQNHPGGLRLPGGHTRLLGQLAFARMSDKLDALGN